MGNRSLLVGNATVEVDQWRYDELLHKEATLNLMVRYLESQTEVGDAIMAFFKNVEVKK